MSEWPLRALTAAVRALASAVWGLARAIEGRTGEQAVEAAADTAPADVGVEGPVSPASWSPVSEVPADQTADSVPFDLVQLCRRNLSDRSPGPEVRASEAYEAGVRALEAIESDTRYLPRVPFQGSKTRHWVVLRSTLFDSFRTEKASTLESIGLRRTDPLLVLETFDSLTEVTVFCAGARCRVPDLRHG
eukprot:Skav225816  [mRNA]  locus=scaffold4730:91972:92541:- [translate_table: standard]